MAAFSWNKLDPHNQGPAVLLLLALAHLARERGTKRLQAYTMWNLSATLFNFAFRMKWENPLFSNSLAIFLCYRTASVDNHRALQERSLLSPVPYAIADTIAHFVPIIAHGVSIYRRGHFVPQQYGAFSLLGQLHFAYSQAGELNVAKLYVPHDVNAAWWSATLGHLLGPSLMNCLISGHTSRALGVFLAAFSVYLSKMLGWRPFTVPHEKTEQHAVTRDKDGLPTSCPLCGSALSGKVGVQMKKVYSTPSINI